MSEVNGVPLGGKKGKKFVVPVRGNEDQKTESTAPLMQVQSSIIPENPKSEATPNGKPKGEKKPKRHKSSAVSEVGLSETPFPPVKQLDEQAPPNPLDSNIEAKSVNEPQAPNNPINEPQPEDKISRSILSKEKPTFRAPVSKTETKDIPQDPPASKKFKILGPASSSARVEQKGKQKMDAEKQKKKVKKTKKVDIEEKENQAIDVDDEDDLPEEREQLDLASDEKEPKHQTMIDSEDEGNSREAELPIGLFLKKNRQNMISKYNLRKNIGHKDEAADEGSNSLMARLGVNRPQKMSEKEPKPLIMFSGIPAGDLPYMKQICRKLRGGFDEDKFLAFTHLIVKEENPLRTKKVLFALVRDCWIVTPEYLFKSLESSQWIDPTSHQSEGFIKRGERPDWKQLFARKKTFVSLVGYDAGFDYASMRNLCLLCGLWLVESPAEAELILSNKMQDKEQTKHKRVDKIWLFDCLSRGLLLPTDNFTF